VSSAEHRSGQLADLPLLPRDIDGPVFEEPWQAQAFAVVAELVESGKITRQEWADTLGKVLKTAEEQGEYDTGHRYYDHWLLALENIVVDKNLTDQSELIREKEGIKENDHHRRDQQLRDEQ